MEFHKILVPVAGTEADEGAMELADKLLAKKNKGEICAVYVISIERALPLDAEIESEIRKAEDILNHIERMAAGQGLRTRCPNASAAGPQHLRRVPHRPAACVLTHTVKRQARI